MPRIASERVPWLTGRTMPEAQLTLFPDPRPLLERFGTNFFRTIPKRPGVYIMTNEAARVLYIGKAKNLRQRLCSYKYTKNSRKVLRLAACVRAITWEVCDDPIAAGMRENELLRVHKPLFNVVNTRSEHYPFVGLRLVSGHVTVRLTKSAHPLADEQLFGAFKGLPLARAAITALFRFFWRAQNPSRSVRDLPSSLLRASSVGHTGEAWHALLADFFSGLSDGLIAQLESAVSPPASRFEEAFHAQEIETLREFFARGPRRNFQLMRLFHLGGRYISQSEVDDLLVLREQYVNPVARDLPLG